MVESCMFVLVAKGKLLNSAQSTVVKLSLRQLFSSTEEGAVVLLFHSLAISVVKILMTEQS